MFFLLTVGSWCGTCWVIPLILLADPSLLIKVMVDGTGIDWNQIVTIASIIGGGGSVAGLLTFFYNLWARKRQEYVEMARYKMSKIGEAEKTYLDLVRHASVLYGILKNFNQSSKSLMDKRSFYYLISFMKGTAGLKENVGGYLLISHDAERAIITLHNGILDFIREKLFDDIEISEIRVSFLDSFSLVDLHRKLCYDERTRMFFSRWKKWLRDEKSLADILILRKMLLCYFDLLTLELNIVYKLWYESELNVFEKGLHSRTIEAKNYLSLETKNYLQTEKLFGNQDLKTKFPNYYKKLFPWYQRLVLRYV